MIATALVLAVIVGPAPASTQPTLVLRVHLGSDHRSVIARHDLENMDLFWVAHRLAIGRHYHVLVDEEANEFPTYQIGYGGERERFPPGTFAASGSFIRTLRSITEQDQWTRRRIPGGFSSVETYIYGEFIEEFPPEVFPPRH